MVARSVSCMLWKGTWFDYCFVELLPEMIHLKFCFTEHWKTVFFSSLKINLHIAVYSLNNITIDFNLGELSNLDKDWRTKKVCWFLILSFRKRWEQGSYSGKFLFLQSLLNCFAHAITPHCSFVCSRVSPNYWQGFQKNQGWRIRSTELRLLHFLAFPWQPKKKPRWPTVSM